MRSVHEYFAETHETLFYLLLLAVIWLFIGVVLTGIREKNAIVSAMITEKKYFKTLRRP